MRKPGTARAGVWLGPEILPGCPLTVRCVGRILRRMADTCGARVALLDAGGRQLMEVEAAEPHHAGDRALPVVTGATASRVTAPVIVEGAVVAQIVASGTSADRPALECAVRLAADWLADSWVTAGEAESLAEEIIHSYEEIHLLYSLIETLSGRLDVVSAADLILEHTLSVLQGAWAELHVCGDQGRAIYRRVVSAPYAADGTAAAGTRNQLRVPIRGGGQVMGTILLVRPEGSPAFSSADESLLNAVATLAGYVIHTTSLHEEVRRQTELALHETEAEAAALRRLDQLKSEFLRTVSHELRTPLTIVLGFAELLKGTADTGDLPRLREMAGHVYAGALHLTRLMDDLVDFARAEQGQIRVQPQPMDLVPILVTALDGLRSQPGGERIVTYLPRRLPLVADPERLTQVVLNLVGNALKYAPAGEIAVRAYRHRDVVRVEVQDHGPGIAPEEQPRVWERFYRGSGVAGLNVAPGAGIGLSLVKTLVEAHGGCVGLRSNPGRGALFWFELPAGGRHGLAILDTEVAPIVAQVGT